MFGVERRELIHRLLLEKGSVKVTELTALCGIGEETIRRDLTKMVNEGLIEKIYGGAYIPENMHRMLSVDIRKVINIDAKKKIASICKDNVNEGDTVFLDGSTTAWQIARALCTLNNLIVISNSIEVASTFAKSDGIKFIGIGGTMRKKTKTFVGHSSVTATEAYHADIAFICCDAVDQVAGITNANEQEAEVRKTMLRQSRTHVLTIDSTKFDKISFSNIAYWDDFHQVITDIQPSASWLKFFQDRSIRCMYKEGG